MADLALVNGPAIIHDDIKMCWANPLGWRSSGVMGIIINLYLKKKLILNSFYYQYLVLIRETRW
jgi:hypothetical protein